MWIYILGLIYWTDTGERKIQRANKHGQNIETIIGKGLHTADGIVIDSIGRKVCVLLFNSFSNIIDTING